jgi:hypothetical protein
MFYQGEFTSETMKLFLWIVLLLTLQVSAQEKQNVVFLKMDNYGSVYITSDTARPEYDYLNPPVFTDQVRSIYIRNSDKQFADTFIVFRHFNISASLPLNWIPLYVLNDKFYVYSPSDRINHYSYTFSDSVLIQNTAEGPLPILMNSYEEVSPDEFRLSLLDNYYKPYTLRIKITDAVKGISLWEYDYGKKKEFSFMVKAENVKQFPMVVCDCGGAKCHLEYKFDTIDEKYIRRKSRR